MGDSFVGEIRAVAFDYAPEGWLKCEGAVLPVQQYAALFSLLGNKFGGDGRSTFALPDMRARVAVGVSQAPGALPIKLGEAGGMAAITLQADNVPSHSHSLNVSSSNANEQAPTASTCIAAPGSDDGRSGFVSTYGFSTSDPDVTLNSKSIGTNTGNTVPVSVMQPYLGMNYIICVQGLYPTRSS